MTIAELETRIQEENKLAREALTHAQSVGGFQQRAELAAQAAIRFGKCAVLAEMRIGLLGTEQKQAALLSAAETAVGVLADLNGSWITPDMAAQDHATGDMRRRSTDAQGALYQAVEAVKGGGK